MCKNRYKQTKFDCMVTNETMQLMKAVIPYIDGPISNLLGIMIKTIHYLHTKLNFCL